MKKIVKILSLLLMGFASVSVQAMPKFDTSKLVQKITEEVGKVQEEAGKIQKDVGQLSNLNQLKDAAGEAQKMKGKLDDAKKKAGEVQSAAGDAQQAVNNAQNSANDLQSATGGGAQELLGLQTELAQSQQNLKNDIQALDDEMQAEIKPLQNNNAVLQKEIDSITQQLEAQANNQGTDFVQDNRQNLQIQIDKNNAEIAEIKEKYAAKQKEKQEAFEKEKANLNEKMDKVKSLAGSVDLNNMDAGNAQKALSGFFSSGGASAMSATMQKNFYGEDEQDSPERNGEIDAYRKKVALDDAADVYARAVKMMSYGDKYIVAVHDLESNAPTAETTPAGIMLEISAKVQQMKILLNYAYLGVAELKMTTAMDMIKLPKHLNNASKDPSVFNLDDYKDSKAAAEAKKKKKGGLSGLIDKAKDAADKAKELKDKYGDDVMNGIEAAKEAKGLYEDASAASSLVFGGGGSSVSGAVSGGYSEESSVADTSTENTASDDTALTRGYAPETSSSGVSQTIPATNNTGYLATRASTQAFQASASQAPVAAVQTTASKVQAVQASPVAQSQMSSTPLAQALKVSDDKSATSFATRETASALQTSGISAAPVEAKNSIATVTPQVGQRQAFSFGNVNQMADEKVSAEAAQLDGGEMVSEEKSLKDTEQLSKEEEKNEEPSFWNKIQQKLGIGADKKEEKSSVNLKEQAVFQAPQQNLLSKESTLPVSKDLKIQQETLSKAELKGDSDKKEMKIPAEKSSDQIQKNMLQESSLKSSKAETSQAVVATKTETKAVKQETKAIGRSAFTMPSEAVSNSISKGTKQEKAQ